MAAARLCVLLGRGISVVAELSNNIQIKAQFWHVAKSVIKIQPNYSDPDLPAPSPLAFCARVAAQGLVEPPDQKDYDHGSTVTQPSLPFSMGCKASPSIGAKTEPEEAGVIAGGRCQWGDTGP